MIAGPNGAGKTTLTQVEPLRNLISGVELLNPDVETLRRLNEQGIAGFATASSDTLRRLFPESAAFVLSELRNRLTRGERIAVETVLSTDKYRSVVRDVLDAQGRFRLIYVGQRTPELAARRVALRVALGGHDVPVQKIHERWRRSLLQLPWFLEHAESAWIFDNSGSDADSPPLLVAEKLRGTLQLHEPDAIPEMTTAIRPLLSDPA